MTPIPPRVKTALSSELHFLVKSIERAKPEDLFPLVCRVGTLINVTNDLMRDRYRGLDELALELRQTREKIWSLIKKQEVKP